ncbi:MAG: GDP-mannose 4,6-dehydratase [Acidobacteria bacterium]|nr:GDP-mannose 4,6-dehydratase [Acidobacteriota bacterium]
MSDRLLVTGGAGFIGSELTRQLASRGAEVVVLDNLVNGRRDNLAGIDGRAELVVGDIRDRELVTRLMGGVSVVFHLACLGVRHSIHSPQENHDVNASGTLLLLQAARAAAVSRFVYVSSSEVYGTARTVPIREDHVTVPATVYGAAKLAGESYARAFHSTYGYPTVVVRPFNSYGPRSHHEGDSGEVIPKFILRSLAGRPLVIFGDGSQTRDFTFVEDTARGIVHAGFEDRMIGETVNIGSGRELRIDELARRVGVLTGRDARVQHDAPRPGDVLRLLADTTRARELFDFKPLISLDEGLGRLLEWYVARPESPDALLQTEQTHNWLAREGR